MTRRARQRPDRDLVAAVRAELAAIEPARRCCRAAERAGLAEVGRGRANWPVVGRLVVRLENDRHAPAAFDWDAAQTHCRLSFLRGLFLAHGSLSLAAGRTHLEFVIPAADLPRVARQLAEIGVPAGARMRRGKGVLTWKSADTVTAFLRSAGGTAATLELEARFVTRSLRGHLNRVVNAESANLHRSVATAHRQLNHIEALRARGELDRLPRTVRAVARERRRSPEATFGQLAESLGTSRALVQRAFERIEHTALHLDDGQGSPTDDRPYR
jgi:DNA-binding protein WhiA